MVEEATPYRKANELMKYLKSGSSGWSEVKLTEAADLANRGVVVVGGLEDPSGSGHVLVVMPLFPPYIPQNRAPLQSRQPILKMRLHLC
jgi:hypothetical protein